MFLLLLKINFTAKQVPFSITFISDEFEGYYAAADDGESEANQGFKLRYFQTSC